jgi:transposase
MRRHELTDGQWARLAPLLPPERPRTGRPARDHRTILNGILWVLRTGAPWRDLPERYGPWSTCWSRFRRWQAAGVWEGVLDALKRDADAKGELDWAVHFVDSSNVRAHQHAAGAKKGATKPSAAAAAAGVPSSTSARIGLASRSVSS